MRLKRIFAAVTAAAAIAAAVPANVSAEWVQSGSDYSYTDASGKKVTGWQDIDGGRYYFDKDGKALTGFKKINGNTYYFNSAKKGKMVTSWVTIGSTKYYFGKDGVMRTGLVKISGTTYYFGNDGKMRTGKIKINDTVYDFGEDGALKGDTGKLSAPMNGLKWNMSMDDVIAKKGLDEYIYTAPMLMVQGEAPFYYIFDSKKGLCAYGLIESYSTDTVKKFKGYFEDDGWKFSEKQKEDGTITLLYTKGKQAGAIMYNSSICMTMVFSEEFASDVDSGNIKSITDLA